MPGLAEFVETHSAAEVAAYQWQQMVEIACDELADIPQERWLEVRYEKLLVAPKKEAQRIAEFCEVEDIGRFIEIAESMIDPEFEFAEAVQPTADEWKAIKKLISPLQSRLGYTIEAGEVRQ